MKKILTILLLAAVVFTTFVACSSSPSSGNKKCYVHIEGKTKKASEKNFFIACDKDDTWYLYQANKTSGTDYTGPRLGTGKLDKATKTIDFGEEFVFNMKTKTLSCGGKNYKCDGATIKAFNPNGLETKVEANLVLTCKCYGAEYSLKAYNGDS